MKKNIHPKTNNITMVLTNGDKIQTHMCWGKDGQDYICDVDRFTHQAWVGGNNVRMTGRGEKFNSKFGNMDFSSLGKKSA